MPSVTLHEGDCLDVMAGMEPDSVDTIITDPPYGLEFMGEEWDRLGANVEPTPFSAGGRIGCQPDPRGQTVNPYSGARIRHGLSVESSQLWHQAWAKAALRVAKPGAMLLAFGGTRTHHRLMCAIEDAGWEIRDCLMWLYGSGFPKSHDISKAIDKAAGAEREVVGKYQYPDGSGNRNVIDCSESACTYGDNRPGGSVSITSPATPAAELWDGWGTALKPAWEPIILAMKPREGTFANNALVHGVAGLWIDGGRIPTNGENPKGSGNGTEGNRRTRSGGDMPGNGGNVTPPQGRWPANLLLDEDAAEMLGQQSGESTSSGGLTQSFAKTHRVYGRPGQDKLRSNAGGLGDTGTAARFFYCSKASRKERNAGLEGMEERERKRYGDMPTHGPLPQQTPRRNSPERNHHPTVKPLDLMRYLCKLTKTPTGGIVLDPFMGSGTTGMAAIMEGRDFIGIELDSAYYEIAQRRIEYAQGQVRQLELI